MSSLVTCLTRRAFNRLRLARRAGEARQYGERVCVAGTMLRLFIAKHLKPRNIGPCRPANGVHSPRESTPCSGASAGWWLVESRGIRGNVWCGDSRNPRRFVGSTPHLHEAEGSTGSPLAGPANNRESRLFIGGSRYWLTYKFVCTFMVREKAIFRENIVASGFASSVRELFKNFDENKLYLLRCLLTKQRSSYK